MSLCSELLIISGSFTQVRDGHRPGVDSTGFKKKINSGSSWPVLVPAQSQANKKTTVNAELAKNLSIYRIKLLYRLR